MLFNIGNYSHSSDVVASNSVAGVSDFKLSNLKNFVLLKIVLKSIANMNIRVWETNSACIVRNEVWVFVWS